MKNISKLLAQPSVFISLEVAVAIFIAVLISLFVILPNLNSWKQNIDQSKETQARIEKIERNISLAKSLDTDEIDDLDKQLELVLPSESDVLRFYNLINAVANLSGMKFGAAQVDQAKTTVTPVPSAPQASGKTPSLSTGGGAGTTPNPLAGQTGNSGAGNLTVKISISGPYANLLTFLSNLEKADRAALINSISISNEGDSNDISAAINFNLPLFSSTGVASAESIVLPTDQEKESIKEMMAKKEITADVSKGGVGKSDPFR